MRPVRLTLQAFGPFAGRAVIDFRAALGQRLFGIYGPTGAGKTSVLDAMAYALFGESSGGERGRGHMRSDLADLNTRTFVEFVFELGARRYVVRREPEQVLRSPRRDSRTYPQSAALFDATTLAVDAITDDASGEILAERRVRDVDEALTRLLGYSADQFRQVVILPQGRFRDLLTASSDHRSTILRGLFDVGVFERAAERLRRDAADLDAAVRAARQESEARLADLEAADLDAVDAQLEAATTLARAAADARPALDARRAQAETALLAGRENAARLEEERQAAAALAAAVAEQPHHEGLRLRLERARRAERLSPLEAAARAAQTIAETAAAAAARLGSERDSAREAARTAAARFEASLAQAPARAEAQRAKERAERILERVTAAEPVRAEGAAVRVALASHQADEARAQAACDRLEADLARTAAALSAARDRTGQVSALKLGLNELKQTLAAARTFDTLGLRLASQEETYAKAGAVLEARRHAAAEASDALSAARARREGRLATVLALSLVDKTPCPVCGSPEHPAPARLLPDDDDPDSELETVEAAETTAREALASAERATGEARVLHQELARSLAALTPPTRPAAALEAEIAPLELQLADLEKTPSLQEIEAAAKGAAEEQIAAQAELAERRTAAVEAKSRLDALDTVLATELAAVPGELHDPARARSHVEVSLKAAEQAEAEHRSAAEQNAAAAKALAVAEAALAERQDEVERTGRAAVEAAGRLVDGIDTAGFDATAFAVALGDLAEAAVLEAALAAFNARLAAAQARANRAAAAAAGPEPDMEGLQAARVAAEVELEALVRSQTRSEAEAQALSLARTRIVETLARQAAAEEAYRHVGALSSLAQGRNEMRMALVDYAVAAYFEDVLRAANIRFDRMSAGRFELRRKTTAQDQRSRSGLEIVVFDAHSGRERDAQTLSGGEGFLAALALALGLSDVVQAEAGGVKLDAIFIDEGFGHLDDESLERALDTLRDMVGEARAVGVISHVDAVKTQIPAGFEVTPGPSGSQILARV